MADKDTDKEFDTCFENGAVAELMEKMMGRRGVGSLCSEMMKKILERHKDSCGFYRPGIMRGMPSQSKRVQEKTDETTEEESHVKGKH